MSAGAGPAQVMISYSPLHELPAPGGLHVPGCRLGQAGVSPGDAWEQGAGAGEREKAPSREGSLLWHLGLEGTECPGARLLEHGAHLPPRDVVLLGLRWECRGVYTRVWLIHSWKPSPRGSALLFPLYLPSHHIYTLRRASEEAVGEVHPRKCSLWCLLPTALFQAEELSSLFSRCSEEFPCQTLWAGTIAALDSTCTRYFQASCPEGCKSPIPCSGDGWADV